MNFYIGYGCALAAILGYIVFAARRLKRDMPTVRPFIDMDSLTDDAPVDELLTRLERFNAATDVSLQVATCRCRKCNPAVSR